MKINRILFQFKTDKPCDHFVLTVANVKDEHCILITQLYDNYGDKIQVDLVLLDEGEYDFYYIDIWVGKERRRGFFYAELTRFIYNPNVIKDIKLSL